MLPAGQNLAGGRLRELAAGSIRLAASSSLTRFREEAGASVQEL